MSMNDTLTRSIVAGLGALALAASPLADTIIDDFEDNENIGGWEISGAGFIEQTGGNPGAWLHRVVDTFAPIGRTTEADSPFVGDFRAMRVTSIAFDAITIDRNFGDPAGFQMSLLLRDTKGTPEVDDDDYAYFPGPQVPLIGEGWKHFEYAIPSQSTDPVPDGWSGGWVGDLENFRPGVDWNDVITSVDRVEIWWIHPAFAAIFATWDVGLDNISITTETGPSEAELTGVEVTTGTILGGGVAELAESDDQHLHTRSGFGRTLVDLHNMTMIVSAATDVGSPTTLDLTIEARIDEFSGTAQVSLRNWSTGEFDQVGSHNIGSREQSVEIPDIDAANYVSDSGEIEVRVKHIVFAPFLAFTFDSFIDEVQVDVE